MRREISLDGQWKLYYYDTLDGTQYREDQLQEASCIPASVPGNVEIDLSEAGILPKDLYRGMATREHEKYESYDWWYQTEFSAPMLSEGETLLLEFDGVDCVAEYYLNGVKFAESENAQMGHSFEITQLVNPDGRNRLSVHIRNVLPETFDIHHTVLTMSAWYSQGGAFVRKPAHSFGWDIFPRAVSAGLWKSVRLVVQDAYDFKELFYHVDILPESKRPVLLFGCQLQAPYEKLIGTDLSVRVRGRSGEDSWFETVVPHLPRQTFEKFTVDIVNPKLWWPYGYGEANIYDTTVELLDGTHVVARRELNVGLRTAQLRRSESVLEERPQFVFVVNGVEMMCRGSNWVPLDAYHSRDRERYARALELASDVGCNMLRVWGGGVYEQECFYDYCDRHGIMIWQDFMMACYMYPFEDAMLKNMETEFTYQVRRLRHHPSIVAWAGDNEVDMVLKDSGINPEVNRITRELIPKVLNQHDPFRPYLTSSPYISGQNFVKVQEGSNLLPEEHLWGARDYYKADFYKNSPALFVSETGYHGCPSPESVKKIVDEGCEWPCWNEQWTLHSSDQRGNDNRVRLMMDQIYQLFAFEPNSLEEFSLASQISQAEAKKYFIERIRVAKPRKTGVLWWNLLDGWPQMSDAVVDYFFEKKLAYHYIKRAQAPFAIMLDEMRDWHHRIVAVNDTLKTMQGSYQVTDIDTGDVLAQGHYCVEPNGKAVLGAIRLMYSDQKMLLIAWEQDGRKHYNHYLCGLPGFSFAQYQCWLKKLNAVCGE